MFEKTTATSHSVFVLIHSNITPLSMLLMLLLLLYCDHYFFCYLNVRLRGAGERALFNICCVRVIVRSWVQRADNDSVLQLLFFLFRGACQLFDIKK